MTGDLTHGSVEHNLRKALKISHSKSLWRCLWAVGQSWAVTGAVQSLWTLWRARGLLLDQYTGLWTGEETVETRAQCSASAMCKVFPGSRTKQRKVWQR